MKDTKSTRSRKQEKNHQAEACYSDFVDQFQQAAGHCLGKRTIEDLEYFLLKILENITNQNWNLLIRHCLTKGIFPQLRNFIAH